MRRGGLPFSFFSVNFSCFWNFSFSSSVLFVLLFLFLFFSLVAAEAVLSDTRETVEALRVSALQQAHAMSHRAETTKEQARKKQLDFLERMKVNEEVNVYDLPVETHVMSGRWVDTMKTPTVWRSKYTARGSEEPQSDEGCFAATATIQGIRMLLARSLD